MTVDEQKAGADRRRLVMQGMLRMMGAIALAMPAVVVVVYYLVGWQASVLTFPALWLFFAFRSRTSEVRRGDRKASFLGRLTKLAMLAGLFVIPIAAVVWSAPEIMRSWAYATAIPMAFAFAIDSNTASRLTVDNLNLSGRWVGLVHGTIWAAVAAFFIVGSELLWLNTSIGVWIWYHAFAFPIFLLMTMMVYEAVRLTLRPEPEVIFMKAVLPAAAEDDRSHAAILVLHRQASAGSLKYENVLLSQALAISGAIDWPGEFRVVGGEGVDGTYASAPEPYLSICFTDAALLTLRPDGEATVSVLFRYSSAPSKGRLLGKITVFEARRVPCDLIPSIIEHAWADNWDGIQMRLSSYEVELAGT